MSTAEQWYIGQRAEALTRVLLTRRDDLLITPVHDDDHGVDFRVEITSNKQPTGRIFGVQVQARLQALPPHALILPNGYALARATHATFPICLFFFTMEDNGAYYQWLVEPILTKEQQPKLSKATKNQVERLNSEEVDRIIGRVNEWYNSLYKTLTL